MATITPISCKSGIVTFASAGIYGEEWAADLLIENERYRHFDMTADANGITWSQTLTSFAGGTGRIRAKYDNTVGARLPNNKGIWLDATGTGWLGYTSTVGFIITYTITNVRPASNTGSPGSTMYDFDFNINSCLYSIVGP